MMKASPLICILIWLIAIGPLCAQRIYYSPGTDPGFDLSPGGEQELIHSIFVVGDVKNPGKDSPVLSMLREQCLTAPEESTIVIVGDIIYPLGMPDSADPLFPQSVQYLENIVEALGDFRGRLIFIPGNHDWARGRNQGWESLQNLERAVETRTPGENVFLPDGGCPGPVEVSLSDDITLIVFDSQWWFQKNAKPSLEECGYEDMDDLFVSLEDAFRRNKEKKVIFATHHPLFSTGYHGGHFPASYLLFPLLEFADWLYLPLPGFIYTGYRKYLGHIQDIPHPEYKILKETLLNILADYPNVIYAAGHEHNLQFITKDSLHHIISGGGGEGKYVARRPKKADFAADLTGSCRLDFYSGGDVWVEYHTPENDLGNTLLYRKKLFTRPLFDPAAKEKELAAMDLSDSTVEVRLTDIYNRGKFTRFWMGNNYRDLWNTGVTLPVFDIGTEKGGLTILKRGGGQQTRSIRMENSSGKQYVLRSVNKFVTAALGESYQGTVAEKVVQDGISASNPYAAVCVPPMADAAGVMHTNPRMVWVPDDPRLGIYRKDMANGAFLFEERPSGNWSNSELFNGSEKIVSTDKVIKETLEEHDHRVDQESVVRARLFDFFLGDWDRHDDQWRWASFEKSGTTIYQPIPRDRDQVFFVNQGVIMWFAGLEFIMPKFKGFNGNLKSPKGLGYNARYFDRSFMTQPDLADWRRIAALLQERLTDSVIMAGLQAFPPEVYALSGEELATDLASRRNQLNEYAEKYYRYLSRAVDVVGTEGRDLFEVTRKEGGVTEVNLYGLNKKSRKKELIYHRNFLMDETREVRLYGLDGKDHFEINGDVKRGMKVRVIGGKGNDSIIDRSRVRAPGKKTLVYDRKDKDNVIIKGRTTKLRLSKDESINEYNRKQFTNNKTMPLLAVGFNIDDGIIVGGGVRNKTYNFRDSTFHKLTGRLAFRTGAFQVSYSGLYSAFSRYFDLLLDADVSMPRNVDYFYGLGNNTEKLSGDSKYYRVRYAYAWVNPQLRHTLSGSMDYSVGLFYQYFKVTDTTDRFIGDAYGNLLDSSAYLAHHYSGINATLNIDTRNDHVYPVRGIHWTTEARGFYSVADEGKNFIKLQSDLALYLSSRKDPRVVLALRAGGAVNLGEHEFYHANFLGQKRGLRGFRSNRFAGKHSFYQDTELRFKLMNFKNLVLNGQTGFLLFNDLGRVWVAGEGSKRWHHGYGIGIWLIPFDLTTLTLTYERSKEENLVTFNFSFLF